MTVDLAGKNVEALVDNYRRAGRTTDPVYVEALRQLELIRTKHLDFNKTLNLVMERARSGLFVGYKEVAEINEIPWEKIHYQISKHLELLCEFCHRKGWPLLSAIVVNADRLATGDMKPESRAGFISAARNLGFEVVDEIEFVRQEQKRVFDWAKSGAST